MTKYRVTWQDASGETQSMDVTTMRQAQDTAKSLQRSKQAREIELSVFVPDVFHELTIQY